MGGTWMNLEIFKHKKEGLLDGISRYHTWDKNLHNHKPINDGCLMSV